MSLIAGASPWDFLRGSNAKAGSRIKGIKLETVPTVSEVRGAIPSSCFERSIIKSSYYLIRDVLLSICVFYAFKIIWANTFEGVSNYGLTAITYWTMYALVQGTVLTGVWVVGHECGHGAFSDYPILNDVVGFITHTLLFVPYFSWRHSHAMHHKYTNHLTRGETHAPSGWAGAGKHLYDFFRLFGSDALVFYQLSIRFLIGWWLYIFFGISASKSDWKGDRWPKNKNKSHLYYDINFPPKLKNKVNLSGFSVAIVALACIYYGCTVDGIGITRYYFGPYMVTNFWLVLYTWLHHTHPEVPHYGDDEFEWIRGALSTLDRPYPALINWLHHDIGSTHVVHHFDHTIPHYHAMEATKALKKKIGPFYREDNRSIVESCILSSRTCHFVSGWTGVEYYKSVREVSVDSSGKFQMVPQVKLDLHLTKTYDSDADSAETATPTNTDRSHKTSKKTKK